MNSIMKGEQGHNNRTIRKEDTEMGVSSDIERGAECLVRGIGYIKEEEGCLTGGPDSPSGPLSPGGPGGP